MSAGLHAALAEACADMPMPPRDARNPHFGSRFASLGAVLASVRPALSARGLRLSQTVEGGEMVTAVFDAAGERAEVCRLPCELPADPQRAGSAVTYYRRYSLLAGFGLVGEDDDDGEGAGAMPPAYAEDVPF